MKDKLMNWVVCWAYVAEGLVGVLSFGYIQPDWVFRASKWYLDN